LARILLCYSVTKTIFFACLFYEFKLSFLRAEEKFLERSFVFVC